MHSRLYSIYIGMKERCFNPQHCAYSNYGGRGISCCEDWQTFQNFKAWAESNGYTDDLTLDRIDVNGNYEPSNCRWSTFKEQQNNRTNNHLIEYNGELKTLQQWGEFFDIKWTTLYKRLQSGWDIEKALTTPVRKYNKKI